VVTLGDEAAIEKQVKHLDDLCGKITKPQSEAWLRENVEVFLVAIAVALGVRTYFIQPFTIPTGSMQPTLNGIIGTPTQTPPPNGIVRFFQLIIFGRSWVNIEAKEDESVTNWSEQKRFLFFSYTRIETNKNNTYWVHASPDTLVRGMDLHTGPYKKGEPIIRGHIDSGDMVFVDKFSYNFRKPRPNEVFVFNTQRIPTGDNVRQGMTGPSQFYIKRLVGTPGDELRVAPPELFINGKRAVGNGFERVMSGSLSAPKDGYLGYSNAALQPIPREYQVQMARHPEMLPDGVVKVGESFWALSPMHYLNSPQSKVTLGPTEYWAMGDNSYHSSDSRDWGAVPQQNIMGRGMFVYWPFTKHWGLIK